MTGGQRLAQSDVLPGHLPACYHQHHGPSHALPLHLRHIWDVSLLQRQTDRGPHSTDEFPLLQKLGTCTAESLNGSWLERHPRPSADFSAFVSQSFPSDIATSQLKNKIDQSFPSEIAKSHLKKNMMTFPDVACIVVISIQRLL